jgi:hypothetical protein
MPIIPIRFDTIPWKYEIPVRLFTLINDFFMIPQVYWDFSFAITAVVYNSNEDFHGEVKI